MKKSIFALLCLMFVSSAVSYAGSADLPKLLEQANMRSGLCLLVGSESMNDAVALAGAGNFYVQVIQSDNNKALAWGKQVAASELREKIGVVNQDTDPAKYASALFDLVVILDGATKLANKDISGWSRIVAPGGVLALQGGAPKQLNESLKLTDIAGWSLLRKAKGDVGVYSPTDSLRWRAGSRWQRMSYYAVRVTFGDGKVLYREGMDTDDGKKRFELICRNAYNGRELWRIEEPPFTSAEFRKTVQRELGFAAAGDKVYVGLGKDFVCLDGQTGKLLTVLEKGNKPSFVKIHDDKYLIIDGKILDINDGAVLGKYYGNKVVVNKDVLYVGGRNFTTYQIPDCKKLWSVGVTNQPHGQYTGIFCSDTALHVQRIWPGTITTLDFQTGKVLWTWKDPEIAKARDVHAFPVGDKLYIAYTDKTITAKHEFIWREVEAVSGKVVRDKLSADGKHWACVCGLSS